jgi:hypothetical protein
VLRLVRCGHSRAVGAGLEKAVKKMLRLTENYCG